MGTADFGQSSSCVARNENLEHHSIARGDATGNDPTGRRISMANRLNKNWCAILPSLFDDSRVNYPGRSSNASSFVGKELVVEFFVVHRFDNADTDRMVDHQSRKQVAVD
jgi:hypothetical protein